MSQAAHHGPRGTRGSICCVLPPKVIGHILRHLDDEERCRVIPPLCKEMYRIHIQHPPPTKRLRIDEPPSEGMVKWCSLVAPTLEKLKVNLLGEDRPGLMPQMLMAALTAGNLRKVSIMNIWDCGPALLRSLIFLTQVTSLKWEYWTVPVDGDVSGLLLFSRLQSLQEIKLDSCVLQHATPEQGDALWKSLAKLRNLNSLAVHISDLDDSMDEPIDPLCHPLFLRSLYLMTRISALQLYNIEDCLEPNGLVPASLWMLTQLTGLTLFGGLSSHSVRHAVSLPRLKELSLMIHDFETQPVPFSICSSGLTSLSLMSMGPPCQAEILLGSCRSVLQRLRSLDLSDSRIHSISDALACSLEGVTYLGLRGNNFIRLPPAIIHMKALQHVDLKCNSGLNFEDEDLKIFTLSRCLKGVEFDPVVFLRNLQFLRKLEELEPPPRDDECLE